MKLRGVLFVILLLYSSTLGSIFFIAPLIPFVYFQPSIGRKALDVLILWWQIYAVAVYEKICGIKIKISGNPMPVSHSGLILMNHRTRFDWLFIMSYQLRCGSLRHFKITLKKSLKNIPGPGWAMQSAGYMFFHRKWEIDQKIITRCVTYFSKVKHKPQVLLFPEGTDLTAHTKTRSDKFAEANGLPKYEYCLHPRTTGFAFLAEKMREHDLLDSVLDVAVAYPGYIAQSEMDVLSGNFPPEVHFHVENYSGNEVPTEKESVEKWCMDLWAKKEELLKNYYCGDKTFHGEQIGKKYQQNEDYVQYLFKFALIFWNVFQIGATVCMIYSTVVQFFTFFCGMGFILVSYYGGMGRFLATTVTPVEPDV